MKFKYITLNIWHGGLLWDQVIEFLKKENPDIIAIQEAYNGTDPSLPKRLRTDLELKAALNFDYSFFSPELTDITKAGNVQMGNLVLSKFPIKRTDVLYFEGSTINVDMNTFSDFASTPRNIQLVSLDVEGVNVNVFNTHGVWGEDGSDSPRRLSMSQKIVDFIADSENAILSGDFNVNQGSRSISMLGEKLTNVFKDELTSSFNMNRKPKDSGYKVAVVDYIFLSPNIKVIDHYCPKIDISDHFPLVAVLEIS